MSTFGVYWFGGWGGPSGIVEEAVLGPAKWHYRMPFFGTVTGANSIACANDVQAVVDREIEMAYACGVDYFAFDLYPRGGSFIGGNYAGWAGLNCGLQRYLTSPRRGLIKFSLLLIGGEMHLGGTTDSDWTALSAQLAAWMADPDYMRVLGNRPIAYMIDTGALISSSVTARAKMDNLRAQVVALGAGNPYLVAANWAGENNGNISTLGFDAISAYAIPPLSGAPGSHSGPPALGDANAAMWATHLASGIPMIPFISLGWDYEPNNENPAFAPGEANPAPWFLEPTPAYCGAQVAAAKAYVAAHPSNCPADTTIAYAWNESGEGGWIVPTIGDNGAKLQGIAAAIGAQKDSHRAYRARGLSIATRSLYR